MSLKLLFLALAFTLLVIPGPAAESKPPAKPVKKSTPAKSDDERTKRGKALLSVAEAEAGSLDGEMRAYAFLQAARAYATFDKAKARELLDQAYTASQVNHEETASKTRLVQQILVSMAAIAPDRAESLLPYAPTQIHPAVLNALLRQYLKKRDFDSAKDMVLQLSRSGDFPYGAASQLMTALPKENSADRQAIFGAALTSFQASSPSDRPRPLAMEGIGLADLVVRFWRDLPSELVKEAIDGVLDDAEKQAKASQGARIMVATNKKSSNFNSLYEYQAQKLLPVLREIDESEAKHLADKLTKLNPSLDPQAGSPLSRDATNDRAPEQTAGDQMAFEMVGMGGPGLSPNASGKFLQMQRAMAVQSLAVSKPQDALAQAATLEPEARAMALEGIARVTAQRDAGVARKALDQLSDTVKSIDPEAQTRHLTSAAEIYLRLEDKASAKRAIEDAADAAEKLYQRDADKDSANQALKAYWPSSSAWKRLIRTANRISPEFAVSLVNDISDADIRATERLALAAELLGAEPDGSVTIVSQKGKPTQMMVEIGDDDSDEGLTQEVSRN